MRALDIILEKRNGKALSEEQIAYIVNGYVDGSIPEYQISAFLMAVYFQGMTSVETSLLTKTMIASGEVIDLSMVSGYTQNALVDKHSTGGVGDKVSLILAPIVAAAGAQVPMMSGRGLGHTGGTLDKLESIPGFSTALSPEKFAGIIQECGFAMTGQSGDIVPADKKLYALRDVTGTVESIPLITASILSKKFAEGAQHLVFDVKYGSGAFMKTPAEARKLADSLVRTGRELGRGVTAVITNMNTPLGTMVGNFMEVEESIHCLESKGWKARFNNGSLVVEGESGDLMEVTLHLSAWMLVVSGVAGDFQEAVQKCLQVIESGAALDRFWENARLQGGDKNSAEKKIGKRDGLVKQEIRASSDGYISGIDSFMVGSASVILGAGRNVASDNVDPDVGIIVHKKPGSRVKKGDAILTLFAREDGRMKSALQYLENVVELSSNPVEPQIMIREVIGV